MRMSDVIAPLGLDEFRESYLDQQWVVINGSSDRYRPLVPWADLNAALHKLRLARSSDRIRLVKGGKQIPSESYLYPSALGSLIQTGAFERQLSEGATLVLNGVDELFGEVRELADDADQTLGCSCWANLYAGWRTQQGFDLHWDDHDTVILQVYGRKAWTVYAPTCDSPTKAYGGSWERPTDPPVWEGILEAGSVLYMPRGCWHFAVPLDEPTLHVTLGLRALTGEDVLHWVATQLHERSVFRANVPQRTARDRRHSYVAKLREEIVRALSDDCLERVEGHALAHAPRFPAPSLPEAVVSQPMVTADSLLLLAGGKKLEVSGAMDGKVSLAMNGERWTCNAGLADAMGRLSGIDGVRFGELSFGLSGSLQTELKLLLTMMVNTGSLLLRSSGAMATLVELS